MGVVSKAVAAFKRLSSSTPVEDPGSVEARARICCTTPAESREGKWLRTLDVDTDSALLWACTGEYRKPVVERGSLGPFRRGLPPGPLMEPVEVDFVVDAEGLVRYAGPAPGLSRRYSRLAVETLETFLFEPATCDGRPIPVFYRLDFAGQ